MKNIQRQLHKLDATDQAVGRLATQVVGLLRGKNKAEFQPHLDEGDIVEVSNISKLKFTGRKLSQSVYHHYSGYRGGLRTKSLATVFAADPGDVLRRAVLQMLPPIKLRAAMIKRLIIK